MAVEDDIESTTIDFESILDDLMEGGNVPMLTLVEMGDLLIWWGQHLKDLEQKYGLTAVWWDRYKLTCENMKDAWDV